MTGVHTNNEAISPCTARSVSAVLGTGAMTGCLEARGARGHCGDGEVDRGEQCDCGDQVLRVQRRTSDGGYTFCFRRPVSTPSPSVSPLA